MARVSIILPTYNRAAFLTAAFQSILAQSFTDWELIVVDDGSTDDTREVVKGLTHEWPQPVRYVFQENQGVYGARNTGLDLAQGQYIAFYDSDDLWLPHHLDRCVSALEANPEVDWAYGASRFADHATNRTIEPNNFDVDGKPRPMRRLRVRPSGDFRVFDDPGVLRCHLGNGLFCALQNSVIRSRVFERRRFDVRTRNEGEDSLFVIRALVAGFRFGYYPDVHVVYFVHENNSCMAATGRPLGQRIEVLRLIIEGMANALVEIPLRAADRRALRRTLGRFHFWRMGYALLWEHGECQKAMAAFRKGLRFDPGNLVFWKTYAVCSFKAWFLGCRFRGRYIESNKT